LKEKDSEKLKNGEEIIVTIGDMPVTLRRYTNRFDDLYPPEMKCACDAIVMNAESHLRHFLNHRQYFPLLDDAAEAYLLYADDLTYLIEADRNHRSRPLELAARMGGRTNLIQMMITDYFEWDPILLLYASEENEFETYKYLLTTYASSEDVKDSSLSPLSPLSFFLCRQF